jgi:hypothetical protein
MHKSDFQASAGPSHPVRENIPDKYQRQGSLIRHEIVITNPNSFVGSIDSFGRRGMSDLSCLSTIYIGFLHDVRTIFLYIPYKFRLFPIKFSSSFFIFLASYPCYLPDSTVFTAENYIGVIESYQVAEQSSCHLCATTRYALYATPYRSRARPRIERLTDHHCNFRG